MNIFDIVVIVLIMVCAFFVFGKDDEDEVTHEGVWRDL